MVNSSGIDVWIEHTTPDERVRTVSETVSVPRTPAWIAEVAAVDETTARDVLSRLAAEGTLSMTVSKGEQRYAPAEEHKREREVQELLAGNDRDDLVQLRDNLRSSRDDSDPVHRRRLIEYRIGLVEDAISRLQDG